MEIKSYTEENYVSVWIGKCKEFEVFNQYIDKKYGVEDEESAFCLGSDFGIKTYNEDFSLVYFNETATKRLDILLDVGAPDYVMTHFLEQYGEELEEEYNCAIMFYDMKYTGELTKCVNDKFGEFVFLGSLFSNKFDML